LPRLLLSIIASILFCGVAIYFFGITDSERNLFVSACRCFFGSKQKRVF
jgi:hypothetical protein